MNKFFLVILLLVCNITIAQNIQQVLSDKNTKTVNGQSLFGTGDITISTSGSPSGTAGGDLAGSYPNPTLNTVGTAGTFGSASLIPIITTDSKGRVTSVSTATPVITVATDVEVTDATKGFIIKAPNGNRYRITINNAGQLVTTQI